MEYFFKHALAQEAAYESTLLQQRKQLHRKVAESIERIFSERIHEFYGMLAFHYSRADDPQKTEDWMTKAGEEALRSSASWEAVHYYQEAFRIYLEKYGDSAAPEKLAAFEKNIGLAYYNKGKWKSAVGFLDSVLQRWGVRSPKSRAAMKGRFFYDVLWMFVLLYWPRMGTRRLPTDRDNEIFDLLFRRNATLLYIDTRRFVSEALNYFRSASKYDLTKIINGKEISTVLGAVWAYMGFFGISKNLLRRTGYGTEQIDINNEIALKGAECLIHVYAGTWHDVPEFDSALVAHAVRSGKFWDASLYIRWHGILKVSQGKFGEAEGLIANLSDLANSYDHDVARLYYYMLKMDFLLKRQDIHQALFQAEEGIPFTAKEGLEAFQTWFAGFKGLVQVMMSEAAPAEVILRQQKNSLLNRGTLPPLFSFHTKQHDFFFISKPWRNRNLRDGNICHHSLKPIVPRPCSAMPKDMPREGRIFSGFSAAFLG